MLMDDRRLDLSALGPEPGEWERVLAATMARVDRALSESGELRDDPFDTIAGWSRPLLLAAAAALAIIIPVEIALEVRESNAAAARRLAQESASWVAAARSPTASEILRAIDSGVVQ
jgi:hypothetical protein